MAELYLAWKIVSNGGVRILFMDRPFSGTYPSLYRDLSFLMRHRTIAFEGLETKEGKIEKLDLYVASVIGAGLTYVPARGIYVPHAALQYLIAHPESTKKELAKHLDLNDEKLQSLLQRLRVLDKRFGQQLISKEDMDFIRVSNRVSSSWQRIRALALEISDRVFSQSPTVKHPLIMENGRWLCVNELNALNLFLLEALIEESIKRQVLVIGVAKDTTATDFTRAKLAHMHGLRCRDIDTSLWFAGSIEKQIKVSRASQHRPRKLHTKQPNPIENQHSHAITTHRSACPM